MYSLFLFPSRDTGRQTARTWYSCAHLMLARTFASALIPCGIAAFFSCFPFIPAQTLELSATTARLCPCCGSMMQLHPVLNDAKFFYVYLIILILVVFAQSGFWIAVPVSCMSASRTVRCFTFSQWNPSLGSCPSSQLAIQERFHIPCGSTRQTLSVQPSIQGREPVTVVGGGTSTLGP